MLPGTAYKSGGFSLVHTYPTIFLDAGLTAKVTGNIHAEMRARFLDVF